MIKQTSFNSPSVEHGCSVCMYEALLLGSLLLLLALQISAVSKGRTFIPATGLSFLID